MLLELKVKNLGIIEDMTWSLSPGLNVITGETGAGKSLVIDAVELLLSGRADEEVIRYGASETQIEGVFALPQDQKFRPLRDLLAQRELDADEETLTISCLIRRKSPAVIRINGHAVPRAFLQQIGRLLVDIHGQSEHLSLLDNRTHLNYLDSFAGIVELRNDFAISVSELRKIEQELGTLTKDDSERARREEFLRFQADEIDKAKLRDGEEEELEKEMVLVSSAEKLKELTYEVYSALYEEDNGQRSASAIDKIGDAVRAMKKLAELDPSLEGQLKLLEETVENLSEAARDIHAYGERVNYDPERLAEIDARLEIMRNLKRKYGQTIKEVLAYRERAERELSAVTHSGERAAELEEERKRRRRELGQLASKLSIERTAAAKRLGAAVKAELDDLNMPQVTFEVSVTQRPDENGIPFPDGKKYDFGSEGADTVEFMVSTNPGEPARPLAKIASTGEISRFTLALKSALSEADNIPVLIFDEIDIGIGGRSGEIIGKKLWGLSRQHQVVCVTHLPQIAAFGDAHFTVRKVTDSARTLSILEPVENESRIRELAAMLTGATQAESSLNSARDLVQNAGKWKEAREKEI